jgi:hypothetical protein
MSTHKPQLPDGYKVRRSTTVGWWVEGAHCYAVFARGSSRGPYHDTRTAAIEAAMAEIGRAREMLTKPAWFVEA